MEVEEVFARFRDIKHGIKSRKRSTSIHYGEHKSGFKGAGYDIVGVERWRPGQPLKDIAWNISLRTYPDKLYKIERMEPKELRTLLVVDLSYSTLFQISHESNKALLMLDLLGNIGLTRANLRDPVGLLGFSDQVEMYLKPRSWARPRSSIWRSRFLRNWPWNESSPRGGKPIFRYLSSSWRAG